MVTIIIPAGRRLAPSCACGTGFPSLPLTVPEIDSPGATAIFYKLI